MVRCLALLSLCLAAPAAQPPRAAKSAVAMIRPLCSWRTSDGGWVSVVCNGNYCTATRYDKYGNVVYSSDDANPGWC